MIKYCRMCFFGKNIKSIDLKKNPNFDCCATAHDTLFFKKQYSSLIKIIYSAHRLSQLQGIYIYI